MSPDIEFQYKICYSKIKKASKPTFDKLPFQYKICYSKIRAEFTAMDSLTEFQYKICYSKIKKTEIYFFNEEVISIQNLL